MNINLDDILNLFSTRGHAQYGGEPISQLEHGLQCATLARDQGANSELITAALLHDLGHLVHDLGENSTEQAIDDRHEYAATVWLQKLFAPAVTTPIELHVEAKRYLCAVDASYWGNLSANSQNSLLLQGGAFSREEAARFMEKSYAKDAVRLRIWDDLAKVEGLKTLELSSFIPIVENCLIPN